MAYGAIIGQSEAGFSSGKRTCRFVVGSVSGGWTADDVDYLCDGTDDQVEINAAINALPAEGGEIVILDGNYNVSSSIVVNKGNVILRGNGKSSNIIKNFRSSAREGTINIAQENVTLYNLSLDVNSSFFSNVEYGVLCSNYTKIYNCFFNRYYNNINALNTTENSTNFCEVVENTIMNSRYEAVSTNKNQGWKILNNYINEAIRGISVLGSNNLISNNTVLNNSQYGIWINGTQNNITSNICYNTSQCYRDSGKYNLWEGNIGIVDGVSGLTFYTDSTIGNALIGNLFNKQPSVIGSAKLDSFNNVIYDTLAL